jgi:putative tryptophan/tyrosine transport system substrate-binding protein
MDFTEADTEGQRRIAAFRSGLKSLTSVAVRWSAGDPLQTGLLAQELVAMAPQAILASGGTAADALIKLTRSIPIVFVQIVDPVNRGLVTNLARPGGNVTGFVNFEADMGSKWIELLRSVAGSVTAATALVDAGNLKAGLGSVLERAGAVLGVRVGFAEANDAAALRRALASMPSGPEHGVVVTPTPVTVAQRAEIIDFSLQARQAAIYPYRFFVSGGGLISYGVEPADIYRRAAAYVDRILGGESTGTLPVQGPTKFDLAVNLRTAKALGLTIPPTLLTRADEVIE